MKYNLKEQRLERDCEGAAQTVKLTPDTYTSNRDCTTHSARSRAPIERAGGDLPALVEVAILLRASD